MIIEIFKSANELGNNFSISYKVIENSGDYFIEAETEGGKYSETAFLGNCGAEKAIALGHLLAEKAVRPIHIEDIISDLRF
jgi:hypothetical protein